MAAPKQRQRWDVWKAGAVWMVQGPAARVDFFSRKTALAVAERGKALDAIEERTRATCAANAKGGQ